MKKVLLTALLATSLAAHAQTESIPTGTISGDYINRMLDYAVYIQVPCIEELQAAIPETATNYLCLVDNDLVPFTRDIDTYLSIYTQQVAVKTPWEYDGNTYRRSILFTDGVMLAMLTTDEVALLVTFGGASW